MLGHHDHAHLVLRLCVRHGVHLTGRSSYAEARSSPHVRLARVPRGEARSSLYVRHACVHHGEARSSPHVRHVCVLLHVRGVCLLAGLRQLVLHDLRPLIGKVASSLTMSLMLGF